MGAKIVKIEEADFIVIESDEDPLNKAFSVLLLQQSEINQDLKNSGTLLGAGNKEEDGSAQRDRMLAA